MNTKQSETGVKMTQYRWVICSMLFFATAINYLDRQVLSLTWDEFIKPEFHWSDYHYGLITSIFSVVYALCMLFAGGFVDRMGSKKGYMWAIGIWSAGACLHALCGIATEWCVCLPDAAALRAVQAGSDLAVLIATVSMYFFIAARCILAMGEAGNFPAAIKVTAEYFPKAVPWIRRQTGRIFHRILHLRILVSGWLGRNEGPRAQIQTHRDKLTENQQYKSTTT